MAIVNFPATLHNVASDGIIGYAEEIYDKKFDKTLVPKPTLSNINEYLLENAGGEVKKILCSDIDSLFEDGWTVPADVCN